MRHLDLEDALQVARDLAGGGDPLVRDLGLLESALHRPRTSLLGEDAYPGVHVKAAALMHSVIRNHALVDGNKRLGLTLALVFLRLNGCDPRPSADDAYLTTMAVASGDLDDVTDLAAALEGWEHSALYHGGRAAPRPRRGGRRAPRTGDAAGG